jgi:hypothetical protein
VEIVASDEAQAHIAAEGGFLYVRSQSHRCCTGPITLLDATTEAPPDLTNYRATRSGPLTVFVSIAGNGPSELSIELRGRRKRRPVAYWDGCAFRP